MRLFRRFKQADSLTVNLLALYAFNFIWSLGNPLVNVNTTMTAYFAETGARVSIVGALQWCVNLPVLFQILPRFISFKASGHKVKMIILYIGVGAGFAVYGILAVFSEGKPGLWFTMMLAVYFVSFVFCQIGNIFYLDTIARIIPGNTMGRYYGTLGILMSVGSVLSGLVAPGFLRLFNFPFNYGILFAVAGVLFAISTVPLFWMREDTGAKEVTAKTFTRVSEYITSLRPCLKRAPVRNLLLSSVFIYAGGIPFNFALLYYSQKLGIPMNTTVLMLAPYMAQCVLIPAVGRVMDRFGHSKAILVYAAMLLGALLLLLSRWENGWPVVFGIFGAYSLFIGMTKIGMVRDATYPDETLDILRMTNILGVVVTAGVTTLCSWVLDRWSAYSSLFMGFGFVPIAIILLEIRQKRLLAKWRREREKQD